LIERFLNKIGQCLRVAQLRKGSCMMAVPIKPSTWPGRVRGIVASGCRGAAAIAAVIAAGAAPMALRNASAQSAASARPSLVAPFDDAMRAWMSKHGVTRGSVAVMYEGRLVLAKGYGVRGANERIPLWSLSKAVTAVCVAALVTDNKLRFDDPIGPLLAPVFKKYSAPADARVQRITVEQLINHRAGYSHGVGGNFFAPDMESVLYRHGVRDASVSLLMPAILKLDLVREPGSGYEYSNVDYLLLGQIIEAVTGESYQRACGERVLARAGVKRPALDKTWGALLHSAAGWSLSGPEYLGFVRLLRPNAQNVVGANTERLLRSTEGKWFEERAVAYTLGVNVRQMPDMANLFHGGAWNWRQDDAAGGAINEDHGTRFVLAGDDVAWFASFEDISTETKPEAIRELDEAFWRARQEVTSWPTLDLFPEMGVAPISAGR
jgi:CubicO group peptidase (beta-lactamase class C family)